MDIVNHVMDYVKTHWVEFLAAIGAIDILLGIITKLTPWQQDDNVYAVIHGWIAKLIKK